ncbi:MAG TPA: hypothetical protein VJH70_00300 [Candidatus Paceibacterota bacterium]
MKNRFQALNLLKNFAGLFWGRKIIEKLELSTTPLVPKLNIMNIQNN